MCRAYKDMPINNADMVIRAVWSSRYHCKDKIKYASVSICVIFFCVLNCVALTKKRYPKSPTDCAMMYVVMFCSFNFGVSFIYTEQRLKFNEINGLAST